MLVKLAVVILLLVIIASLASALVYLVKDQGTTKRTLNALTLRIALSLVVFVLLMIGFATGLLTPHGIVP